MQFTFFDADGNLLWEQSCSPLSQTGFDRISVDAGLLGKAGRLLAIRTRIDIIDIQCYWTAEMMRPSPALAWVIQFQSAAQRNFPYLTFFEQGSRNRAAIALTCLKDDVSLNAKMNQEQSCYDLTIQVAVTPETDAFDLLFSEKDVLWSDLLAEYRSLVVPELPKFPEAAWNPVYCTWYAVHAALTMNYLEANAKLAAELGFGTLIVDDGWCFDRMKRVTPQTLVDWYCDIGDWILSEKKLPEFREHVRRTQKLGLRYLVWVAPFFIGRNSKAYQKLHDPDAELMSNNSHEGHCVLDPSSPEVAAYSMERMVGIMRELGLDGLKIDFLDYVQPSVEKPRSRVTLDYIRRMIDGIRSIRHDALIEFRQRYATPGMLPYATQFRAGDVPFDYLENIHRIAQIRLVLGDGVPAHADPVYFHEKELPPNVSRHMIASLAGVPMLSMDLERLTQEQRHIITHWLTFYKEHLATFQQGHWQVTYGFGHLTWISVSGCDETIVILLNENDVDKLLELNPAGTLHILNLSNHEISLPGAVAMDCSGQKLNSSTAPKGGRLLRSVIP